VKVKGVVGDAIGRTSLSLYIYRSAAIIIGRSLNIIKANKIKVAGLWLPQMHVTDRQAPATMLLESSLYKQFPALFQNLPCKIKQLFAGLLAACAFYLELPRPLEIVSQL
jgi:hypothetical protein